MTLQTKDTNYQKVYEFHEAFGLPIYDTPQMHTLDNHKLVSLRIQLINEELEEFIKAYIEKNLLDMIDAITDTIYVIYGTCISFGIILDIKLNEIHNYDVIYPCSTMTHLYIDDMKFQLNKLDKNIITKNMQSVTTTLYEMLVLTYQYGIYVLKIDINCAFDIVHKSNMTKLCKTEQEAQDTIKWYIEHEHIRYDSPKYKKSNNDSQWIVYNQSTGKILKSIYYTPPNLSLFSK